MASALDARAPPLSESGLGIVRSLRLRRTSHPRHDNDIVSNRKCWLYSETYVVNIRYYHPLVHINGSDMCAIRTVETNFPTRTVTPRHRGGAEDNCLPGGTPQEPRSAYGSIPPPQFPYDIVEMIVAYLIHDLLTLKACSSLGRSWYIATAPHLHHTLTLKGAGRRASRSWLGPLSKLHKLGLLHLAKEIRVDQGPGPCCWFLPRVLTRHFFALANVHTMKLENMAIFSFFPDIEHYFGHFSPTLRSIALCNPYCTPRQLSRFLSLFSNLDDIEIQGIVIPMPGTPDTEPLPSPGPKLRGRLVLYRFSQVETWTDLITSYGGLRFRHMDLDGSPSCAGPLLKACAETLETLRFDVKDDSLSK